MKSLSLFDHLFAILSLGLLCGWYQFVILITPLLLLLAYNGSIISGTILAIGLVLSFTSLKHEPWDYFTQCWIWRVWRDYFDFQYETNINFEEGKRYMFFEFSHGIFPMGQFLSASIVENISPGKKVCGTAANVVFMFPIMRQIMSWIGTHHANRKNIGKIFKKGYSVAIIPGGIAEMYLINDKTESIYLRKRHNTVKAAIEEGATIIPTFFFGNSRIFTVLNGQGSDSWISKVSRKLRASIFFFYGRFGLPIPYRHPLKMITGEPIPTIQSDKPSEEYVNEILNKVIVAAEKLYSEKKPEWETRPLVII